MPRMKTSSSDRGLDAAPLRTASGRLEGVVGAALLAIGTAALIGWALIALYVKVVTID